MDYDVIVAGAGPGGAIAARNFARAELKVGLFDADELDTMGKSIVVEAEKEMFDLVGVKRPEGDEVPYHQKRMRVFSKNGKDCFTLEGDHPAMSIRLDEFSQKLAREAVDAGAEFVGGHKALGPVVEGGKVVGAVFKTKDGKREVRARITIDATGFSAALAGKLPPEMGIEFTDKKEDVVIAENYFHEIDVDKAKEAIDKKLHFDDEVWNRLSGHGNFSTEYSYLSLEKKRAYILLGRKAAYDQPAIIDVIDRFREEQGYYGECLYGGQGPIRVRRSLDQLVAHGFMAIGEAACTIIPAHGSGVSSALYTGHLAAMAATPVLLDEREPTAEALWPYSYLYQSGRGAVLATYAAQKLMIDQMTSDQLAAMLESGAMQAEDLHNGAVPEPIGFSAGTLPSRAMAIVKNPGVLPVIVKMGLMIGKVKRHYEKYPATFDKAAVDAWKDKTREIFGPLDAASV